VARPPSFTPCRAIPLLVSVIGGSLWGDIFQTQFGGSACDLLLGYQPLLRMTGSNIEPPQSTVALRSRGCTAELPRCRHAPYVSHRHCMCLIP